MKKKAEPTYGTIENEKYLALVRYMKKKIKDHKKE